MFRTIYPSALGGLAVLIIILAAAAVLGWFGASFGEALYVSISGLIAIGYGVNAWRLRKGK
jgi:hypothetical protein